MKINGEEIDKIIPIKQAAKFRCKCGAEFTPKEKYSIPPNVARKDLLNGVFIGVVFVACPVCNHNNFLP